MKSTEQQSKSFSTVRAAGLEQAAGVAFASDPRCQETQAGMNAVVRGRYSQVELLAQGL